METIDIRGVPEASWEKTHNAFVENLCVNAQHLQGISRVIGVEAVIMTRYCEDGWCRIIFSRQYPRDEVKARVEALLKEETE